MSGFISNELQVKAALETFYIGEPNVRIMFSHKVMQLHKKLSTMLVNDKWLSQLQYLSWMPRIGQDGESVYDFTRRVEAYLFILQETLTFLRKEAYIIPEYGIPTLGMLFDKVWYADEIESLCNILNISKESNLFD